MKETEEKEARQRIFLHEENWSESKRTKVGINHLERDRERNREIKRKRDKERK